ncbi:ferredoxin:protochlorophyllide reductase (ATP-dependent) subunit B [Polynucleobacter antarcticus]|uniref:Light-independent protochlorophyllide reductase subunit B n=1 Tax=Polynucleobacter antarcticus TaxID=1743162 RepID=A0A6M9PTJ1_9BURK|nr:ferredoxin:protochlorophyllide reductase (ATP-dependent) subunit B [Polynucleobacter antarcticus]QKM62197.1 ferredoxin:protochlorophyllide reductase (ATP-dependent) subunit B [Polynucleobacter antarcticus]
MQLTLWTYEGPPHIGAMRIATSMTDLHYVLHSPQGDTYADLLFTMIGRSKKRPPVTYTTFQARDLGGDTAQLFQDSVSEAYRRFEPKAMIVGASCTAELIQDDPGGLARALSLPIPVIPLDLPSYQKKENWGASETFYHVIRALVAVDKSISAEQYQEKRTANKTDTQKPSCNILGPTALGFRNRDDVQEIKGLLESLGIEVRVVAPLNACVADLVKLPQADFNVSLYPEVSQLACTWLSKTFGQPFTKIIPVGTKATKAFIHEVCQLAQLDPTAMLAAQDERAMWYAKSVDSTYLTDKRVFIFGDASHAIAAAKVASEEIGFKVVGLGTYSREFAREVREAAKLYGIEALITDDYLEVEEKVAELTPDLVLGTQMERHIAKRLGVPCAVISAPVHVQDFPARYSPQMGFEGANVLFDTWIHPLMMGLEEHLLMMFRDDFEFSAKAAPSHLGHARPTESEKPQETKVAAVAPVDHPEQISTAVLSDVEPENTWEADAEKELGKIPFFVRGKARRNTEKFAVENGISRITIETLYDAKAHYGR